MNKEEFLQLSDDEKWDLVIWLGNEATRLENELSKMNGISFNEEDVIEDLEGRLLRKLRKYEKKSVKSFFAYAKTQNFKWKHGVDMCRHDVSNYLYNNITKIEDIF